MIGQKINRLTLIKEVYKANNSHRHWLCKCDCGNEKVVRETSLKKNKPRSCGKCYIGEDLSKQRFGKLLVIGISHKKGYEPYWLCKCDCGKETVVLGYSLRDHLTKSCGCNRERQGQNSPIYRGCGQLRATHWSHILSHAKTRKIPVEIGIKNAWKQFEKQNGVCSLSGIKLHLPANRREVQTASLDRIDSTKGYTLDNIQWVHRDINIMKMHYSTKRFIEVCNIVSLYNQSKMRVI